MTEKKWKLFIVTLLCQLAITASQAQGLLSIGGQVLDANLAPLPGVSVKIKDLSIGASTDANGNYTLRIPANGSHTLEFSSVGFESRQLQTSAGRTVYNVQMKVTTADLNEIIVVGYGTSRRQDLTGSVGSVKVADLQKAPVASFDQALAGRVAGVQVSANDGQPGNGLNIVVRGNNSISQSNAPLYVVDGFPIETSLNTLLNPSEIESIEVLKDASATAIYGARGANGVIMVTTKQGIRGEPKIDYQGFIGIQNEIKRMDMMSPYEFVKYQLELDATRYTPIYLADGRDLESYRDAPGVDWQDQLFRTAPMHTHSIAVRGGTEKTKYSFSGSLLNQDGVILNGGFNRYQGRVVLDQDLGKKVKAGVNVNYSSSKSYGTQVGSAQGSPTSTLMYSIWGYRPVTGNDDSSLIYEPYDPDVDPNTDLRFNPLLTATNTFNPQVNNTILTNAYVEYNVLSNLRLRVTGGLTRSQINSQRFNNSNTQSGNPISSVNGVNGSITNSIRSNYLNENTLTYTPKLGNDHNLTVLGGFTIQKVNFESSGFTSIQIPNEVLGISGIDEGIVSRSASELTSNGLASFLGRVNYDYRSKYLLTASFRSDGSSKFSDGNKWSYFPSISVAWKIVEEPFMESLKFLSNAKIRGGYGQTGNNRVSDFAYLSSYAISPASGYTFNNAPLQGIIPDALGTRDLKWETTEQTDIGADLAFLKNRIVFTADFYYKKTKDLLLNASLAPSMGYLRGFKNIGKVSNQGWEFSLDTRNVETDRFSWSSSFNISFNKNKVLQLSGEQPNLQTSITWGNFNSAPYIAIPGKPIALFNGYVFDGIYQISDFNQLADGTYELKPEVPNNSEPRTSIQPGHVKYKDIDGDGEVNADDITIIGDPNPTHTGGFSNNFTYGGFDLNVFFQWSYGNDLLNVNRIVFEGGDARQFLNMFSSFENRWTPENQSNTMYSAVGAGPRVYSSRVVEDGSYLRLKTLALGYTIPQKLLRTVGIKNLRVYASGQNLITWTNYSGPDPEASVRQSALTPGFDLSAYPQMRTITFGLNLTL
jgi:TonB-dependent starch-binding outer membrane protein SusC